MKIFSRDILHLEYVPRNGKIKLFLDYLTIFYQVIILYSVELTSLNNKQRHDAKKATCQSSFMRHGDALTLLLRKRGGLLFKDTLSNVHCMKRHQYALSKRRASVIN